MRFLADTNIVAPAVRALRDAGHDVAHVAERASDPGDSALLAEALTEHRVFISKDRDIGALVYRDGHAHCGVPLIDSVAAGARHLAALLRT